MKKKHNISSESINKLADEIFSNNIEAGWHVDQETNSLKWKSDDEFFILLHSELAEATESFRKGTKDSHLTEYDGVIVEIADYLIRLLDFYRSRTVRDLNFDGVVF